MKRWLAILAVVCLVLLAAGGGLAYWGWQLLHTPFGPTRSGPTAAENSDAGVLLEVRPGQGAGQILDLLAEHQLIPHALLARLYLVYLLDNPPLQAGEYLFESPATTPERLAKLIGGDVVLHPVTVVEGQTLEETAATLAAAGLGSETAFLSAMRSPLAIADLDPEAETLEGYLFPDTYSFPRATAEAEIVATMVATFRSKLEQAVAEPPETSVTSVRDLVSLASIVEKEAQLDDERPVIAAVYRNRLDRGIGLYADPTIIFALKQLGSWDGDIRRRDLELDSPYNTYRYPGLPPGPICSPGLASLRAAAQPASVPYLYFVSRNDGSHVFAKTLREHNHNVDVWQRRYWRDRRKKGAQ